MSDLEPHLWPEFIAPIIECYSPVATKKDKKKDGKTSLVKHILATKVKWHVGGRFWLGVTPDWGLKNFEVKFASLKPIWV